MKRLISVSVALLVLLSIPDLVSAGRGLMGMWVNTYDEENCASSSYNTGSNDNFYRDIRNRLAYYVDYYPQKTQYSQGNVHGDKILESWREYWHGGTWHDGIDRNDATDRTVLIISTHGNVSVRNGDDYFFRTLHRDNDRYVDRGLYCLSSQFQKCHMWWRNVKDISRELIRMGSRASSTSIGDGDCRWIIFHTCRNLQLELDDHDDFSVQDLWGWNDLNGGYRAIIGGSGGMYLNVGNADRNFVTRQYASNYTFKQAWFDTMDDEFKPGNYEDDGRCVVYAKGGTTGSAQTKRDNDDFLWGSPPDAPLTALNWPDGWYSAWSSMNCEDN